MTGLKKDDRIVCLNSGGDNAALINGQQYKVLHDQVDELVSILNSQSIAQSYFADRFELVTPGETHEPGEPYIIKAQDFDNTSQERYTASRDWVSHPGNYVSGTLIIVRDKPVPLTNYDIALTAIWSGVDDEHKAAFEYYASKIIKALKEEGRLVEDES